MFVWIVDKGISMSMNKNNSFRVLCVELGRFVSYVNITELKYLLIFVRYRLLTVKYTPVVTFTS